MTIAAGLICDEGVIICADSQETVGDYIKYDVLKIVTHIYLPTVSVSIAGAGSGPYIDTAVQKLLRDDRLKKESDLEVIEQILEDGLLTFFDRHLARWSYYPEGERPTVDLLIGVTTDKQQCGLYHSSGTAFHRTSSVAVGTGILLANHLISQFARPDMSMETLMKVALYILAKVKQKVAQCGGFSTISCLHKNGDVYFAEGPSIEPLEREFQNIDSEITQLILERISKTKIPLGPQLKRTRHSKLPQQSSG